MKRSELVLKVGDRVAAMNLGKMAHSMLVSSIKDSFGEYPVFIEGLGYYTLNGLSIVGLRGRMPIDDCDVLEVNGESVEEDCHG